MLTVLICAIGGLFTANHLFPVEQPWEDNFGTLLLGFMIGGVVGLIIAAVIGSISGEKEEKVETKKLVSLRGASYVAGDFFLGIGSVNSCPCYLYYEMRDDGGCVLRKTYADSDDVRVYEEDRKDGVLEVYDISTRASLWWGFGEERVVRKFRIPKDSIKREFSL